MFEVSKIFLFVFLKSPFLLLFLAVFTGWIYLIKKNKYLKQQYCEILLEFKIKKIFYLNIF